MTVLIAAGVAVLSSVTIAKDKDPRTPAPFATDPQAAHADAQETREAEERKKARRATPEAKEDRRRSRSEYKDYSGRQASDLAVSRFPSLFSPADRRLPQLRGGQRVDRYLGRNAALVDVPNASSNVLVDSMLPLQTKNEDGALAPVDLDLVDDGGALKPRNPLAPVRISRSARAGMTVPGLGSLGLDGGSGEGSRVRNEVFYADAQPDTDMWIKPIPTGAAFAFQLRSEDSPEQLRLDLDLPPEIKLVRDELSGAIKLLEGTKQVGLIGAPLSLDAESHPVDSELRVSGEDLILSVPHRSADVRYPVAVDPVWEYWNFPEAQYDYTGWNYFESSPVCNEPGQTCLSFWHLFYDDPADAHGRGLYIRRNSGGFYSDGEFAQYYYTSPRQSFIYEARFIAAHRSRGTRMAVGIWSPSLPPPPGQPWGNWETYEKYPDPARPENPADVGWGWWRFCANYGRAMGDNPSPCYDQGGDDGNQAVFALSAHSPVETSIGEGYFGYSEMWLNDRNNPTWGSTGSAPTNWAPNHSGTLSVRADDAGLGAKAVYLDRPSQGTTEVTHACNGSVKSRCPDQLPANLSYDTASWPEGRQTMTLRARDIIDRWAPQQSKELRIDRTAPPTPTGTGTLPNNNNTVVSGNSYDVAVNATDQSNLSGVGNIQIWVDKPGDGLGDILQNDDGQGNAWNPPANGDGAPMSRSFRLQTPNEGQYKVTIRSVDRAGNSTPAGAARIYTVIADHLNPVLASATHSGLPTGWFETASITTTLSGTDAGSGVREAELILPNGTTRRQFVTNPPCNGISPLCPPSASSPFSYNHNDLLEGARQVGGRLYDAAGRGSNQINWQTKLDRTPPATPPTITGPLATPNGWVGVGPHPLDVTWTDPYSGVKSAEIQVEQPPISQDSFNRTRPSDWGDADLGGWWNLSNADPAYVDGSKGFVRLDRYENTMDLVGQNYVDTDTTVAITFPALPASDTRWYGAATVSRFVFMNQAVEAWLKRRPDGVIVLESRVVPGYTAAFSPIQTALPSPNGVSQTYNLRVQLEGQRIRVRTWAAGAAEPTTWLVDTTSTLIPTAAGRSALRTSSGLNTGYVMGFDNLSVRPVPDYARGSYTERTCTANSPPDTSAPNGGCPPTLSQTYSWSPGGMSGSTQRFKLIATDPLGHRSEHPHQVRLDGAPPTVTISGNLKDDAADRYIQEGIYDLRAVATEPGDGTTSSGLASVKLQLDGVDQPAPGACDSGIQTRTCNFKLNASRLPDGNHTVKVLATDVAGNQTQASPLLQFEMFPRTGRRSANYTFIDDRVTDKVHLGVNVANGNAVVRTRDFDFGGSKIDLPFEHTTNTIWSRHGGDTGLATTANLGAGVKLRWLFDNSRVLMFGDGSNVRFTPNGDGTFTGPKDADMTLATGTGGTFVLTTNEDDMTYTFTGERLTAVGDPWGIRLALAYNATGGLASITDTEGAVYAVTSDSAKRITKIVRGSQVWEYRYTTASGDKLTSVTSPGPAYTNYDYDSEGRLMYVDPPTGNPRKLTYDSSDRIKTVVNVTDLANDTGPTTTYTYNTNSTVVTDPQGRTQTFNYDPASLKVTSTSASPLPSDYTTCLAETRDATYCQTFDRDKDADPEEEPFYNPEPAVEAYDHTDCTTEFATEAALYCREPLPELPLPPVDPPPPPPPEPAATFEFGISEFSEPESTNDPRWRDLRLKHFRTILPYNIVDNNTGAAGERDRYDRWKLYYRRAVEQNLEIMVSFERLPDDDPATARYDGWSNERQGTHLPSDRKYLDRVRRFRKKFPMVKWYAAWNEPNGRAQPTSVRNKKNGGGAIRGAHYTYLMQKHICPPGKSCQVVGGDMAHYKFRSYFDGYVNELRTPTFGNPNPAPVPLPVKWAFHPYLDVDNGVKEQDGVISRTGTVPRDSDDFKAKVEALPGEGQRVWFTEVGAWRWLQNIERGSEALQAEKVRYLIDDLAAREAVERVYYYPFWLFNGVIAHGNDAALIESPPPGRPGGDTSYDDTPEPSRQAYEVWRCYGRVEC